MRFLVRSSGGKLIVLTTIILLLCLLLFIIITWSILGLYSRQNAQNTARTHLVLIAQNYQTQTAELSQQLTQLTKNTLLVAAISQPVPGAQTELQNTLLPVFLQHRFASLSIITRNHQLLAQLQDDGTSTANIPAEELTLVDQTLQTSETVLLKKMPAAGNTVESEQWQIVLAIPISNTAGKPDGILLATQPINTYFAQTLLQQGGDAIALCITGQLIAATGLPTQLLDSQPQIIKNSCTPDTVHMISGAQQYLTLSSTLKTEKQPISSPHLVAVAVESLDGTGTQRSKSLLIALGIALFIFALGVLLLLFVIRIFLTQPIRQLQNDVSMLITNDNKIHLEESADEDELAMLARSFHLLSESLENESQAMTEQISNLLIISYALISTLNLEELLGEIVLRLGTIMQVKHVSLLLYGREMLAPWAVAHYTTEQAEQQQTRTPSANPSETQQKQVYIDPAGDITLAATTKMVAVSAGSSKQNSGKQHQPKTPPAPPYPVRRPHIPRSALRDLDLILSRIVIQKQKIAYGEDIPAIFAERKENWTKLALDTGYRSVIAVPLLLQKQAIGAFILYADEPHFVSSRDTFLLSTAALQVSMGIQNALLFAEVKEKNTALEHANQLKSQFLANVTHELRTPLHSIISYGAFMLEGFVEGELTSEQEQHIQFIVRRAEDLSHLVDDMLDLSKIEADKIEVRVELLDLQQSLEEVVEQLKPMANSKELYLRLEIPPELPAVLADGHRLRQVAINLVSNALKFTEKGGITIRCRLVREGEMVMVGVHDTGIGILPPALNYIFEAFRQADGSTTRRFGGTGLGLTIAKKLIELQGGEVAVESVPGQGSTFSFILPVAPSEETLQ